MNSTMPSRPIETRPDDLVERLKFRAWARADEILRPEDTLEGKAASALRSLAAENVALKAERERWMRSTMERAREREIFRDGYEAALSRATAAERVLGEARAALKKADTALEQCDELFSDIRGDWSDPRSECREGLDVIEQARTAIRAARALAPVRSEETGAPPLRGSDHSAEPEPLRVSALRASVPSATNGGYDGRE